MREVTQDQISVVRGMINPLCTGDCSTLTVFAIYNIKNGKDIALVLTDDEKLNKEIPETVKGTLYQYFSKLEKFDGTLANFVYTNDEELDKAYYEAALGLMDNINFR